MNPHAISGTSPSKSKGSQVLFEDLLQLYEQEQNINECLEAGRYAAQRLKPSFAGFTASEITPMRVNEHILRRQRSGAENATINRELGTLKRMFSLGVRYGLVDAVPYIPKLKESPPRQGFLEPAQLFTLLAHLDDDVRPLVEFLFLSGWRKREALRLEWSQVSLSDGLVRLLPQHSKNREARLLPLAGRLRELMHEQAGRKAGPWVFHRNGERIHDFRMAWKRATEAAGVSGLLVHDLRRSAVRNLVRAGISEGVAMKLTGHKTRSVFERYNITNEADLRGAVEKLDGFITAKKEER